MNSITPRGDGVTRIDRIYFEPVERKASLELLENRFYSASIFEGSGLWLGSFEKLMVFEIHTDVDPLVINDFAEQLRALNHQKSVRITSSVDGTVKVRDINSPVG